MSDSPLGRRISPYARTVRRHLFRALATASCVAAAGVLAGVLAGTVRAAPASAFQGRGGSDSTLRPLRRGDGARRGRARFDVRVDGEPLVWAIRAFTVLPEQGVRIAATGREAPTLTYQGGSAEVVGSGWRWIAPARPGIYALRLVATGDTVDLTALVLHPASAVRNGSLHGYRIGTYRAKPLRGDPSYLPPDGFLEVAEADRSVLASPHFILGDFLCKQPGEPRYVALTVPLLLKLESITAALEEHGVVPGTLRVMSGYRTPAYNAAIGNRTVYSRHLWGDAADVYVDADRNGDMDDLDGDGRSTVADARLLARWINGLSGRGDWRPGGLGIYGRSAAHGPFVHVDARGTRARW